MISFSVDILTVTVIVCMLLCVIIIPLGERDARDNEDYKALKRKYKKLEKNYMRLLDVFEKIETDES